MIPIHVAYAEDHVLLRNATVDSLKARGLIVSDFPNGREMIEQLRYLQSMPDICIVNVRMPLINGFETTRQLRKYFGRIKVLAYSMSDHDRDIIGMLSSGASGYLIKNGDVEELVTAIIAVHEKGVYLNEE